MNAKIYSDNIDVISFRLDYSDHISLIKKGTDSKFSKSYYVRRFQKILKSMVTTFNRLKPYYETLFYIIKEDCIHLRMRTKNQNSFEKARLLIITYNNTHYFAPWIYDHFQRSSRFIISKNIVENCDGLSDSSQEVITAHKDVEHSKRYLVHRSYPNRELQHPGGHLEYVEVLVVPKIGDYFGSRSGSNDTESYFTVYSTAYDYTRSIVLDVTSNKSSTLMKTETFEQKSLSTATKNWAIYGGIREVLEESGLDLRDYVHRLRMINLLKIGSKTFYFGVEVDADTEEEGPLPEFASELIGFESITVSSSSTNTDTMFLADLDRFWIDYCNQNTDHAWISALDMLRLWNPDYKDHILELMSN